MIPLSIPHIAGNESKYVSDCLNTGWISSAGGYVSQFERMVADFAGTKYGVACMNGTAGLHLCQRLLGIGHGDMVIVPNITFIASLNSIDYTGAEPILIDVYEDTWQMNLDLLYEFLKNETYISDNVCIHKSSGKNIKAIMPVHVLGNMGDIEQIMGLADKFCLEVIEDSTESLGSYFKKKHSGSFGIMGVFSFNGNKIISTGGGGVIVTDNEDLAKQAKHLSTQAKISPDEYIHDAIGYNYRLVNVLAAIGVAQMEQLPDFIEKKIYIDTYYRKNLEGIADIRFQKVMPEVNPNCWLFTFKTARMRELLVYLNDNGIQSRPFWKPMNQLEMFRDRQYVTFNDASDRVYNTAISIPSSVSLSEEQLATVVNKIKDFYVS